MCPPFTRKCEFKAIAPSRHAPLLPRPSTCRLVLKLLPFSRRLVILPMNHVRINFLRSAKRPVAGEQVRAVRVYERVEARALRELESAE
jgi:hypothetical protein